MEDGNQVRMAAGERFVFLNALELAAERAVVAEFIAADDFDRPQRAQSRVARQPDFAVGAATDDANEFVIGNGRRLRTDIG